MRKLKAPKKKFNKGALRNDFRIAQTAHKNPEEVME